MSHINFTSSGRPLKVMTPPKVMCHDFVDQRPSYSGLRGTHTGKVQRTINLPALYTGVCGLPKFMKFRVLQNFMTIMNLYYKSTLWLSLQKFMIFNLFKANFHEFKLFMKFLLPFFATVATKKEK